MTAANSKVVWITGAAGGLGQALAAAFQREGWQVAASYHRAKLNDDGGALLPVGLNVTRRAEVFQAVETIMARWGRLDVLIHCAGANEDQSVWAFREENWDRIVDVNLKGAFLCSQAALPRMKDQGGGNIMLIGSFAARQGTRGQAPYAAAKAGLFGLVDSLAKEAGPQNIRINAILPGVLRTPMTENLDQSILSAMAKQNALGRLNDPEEVARFAVFLATTRNISGQLFQLDSRIAPWT